jgi:hypothetical protein
MAWTRMPALRQAAPRACMMMLTVSEDAQDLATALRNGASGYLLKTMEGDALASAIRRAVLARAGRGPEMTASWWPPSATPPMAPRPRRTAAAGPRTGGIAVAARAGDPAPDRGRRQQQGDRPHAGDRRDDGQDPCPAHPAQAGREPTRVHAAVWATENGLA